MSKEVCVPAIKLAKERLLEERAVIDEKIKALDIVLEMFDEGNPDKSESGKTDRVKPVDEEKKEYQRKAYKKWYDKQKALKQEKMDPDIEVEKGTDLQTAKKKSKINYDDMG